ncbi:MAG: CpXC domain-containing protein [Candidatus Heritagella sp.]
MSIQCHKTINCPQCGEVNEIILWQSLNGDLNPEAKRQLLDGNLFRFRCCQCGYQGHVDYAILYHDMAHKGMIYYVAEDAVAETREMIARAEKRAALDMSDYTKRIVTSQNALREKAILLEYGLDDRVIEVIKLLYFASACQKFPDASIQGVFFLVAEGKYILDFVGDKPLCAQVPAELYMQMREDCAAKLEAGGDENVIDMNWARKFMRRERQAAAESGL